MAPPTQQNPYGTCDRCGDALTVAALITPHGGYSTPCRRCVDEMIELRKQAGIIRGESCRG
jgi:hypothetical protein